MLEDITLGAAALGNPSVLQYNILKIIQNVALNGASIVGSANNGFCQLVDMSTSVTAQFVKQEDRKFNVEFPVRSLTVDEVYPHLSDYDYLNTTAQPAGLKFRLLLDRQWVIDKAVPYDDNYNRLEIPDTMRIVMGSREFGIYYPIQFLVNKRNGTMVIEYGISSVNPLKSVTTNMLIESTDWERDGTHYLNLVFDAYQFMRRSKTVTVDKENGYSQTFAYQDQFYAARVYTNTTSGWTELKIALSQMVYDPTIATAVLTPLPDKGVLKVDIPQVYFTTGLMGSQVKVDIYSTEGVVNTVITQEDVEGTECIIDTTASVYSAPFQQPTTMMIIPYNTTLLKGGSDAKDFISIRSQYMDRSLYTQVPILPQEVEAKVNALGFKSKKEIDNITDRIFVAGAAMTFEDGTQVPTVVSNLLIDKTYMKGDPSSILTYPDDLVTILPTTVFQYDQTTNTSVPVQNDTFKMLNDLDNEGLVETLNSTTYTRQPFHIVLSHASKYPTAKLINMMDPTETSLIFKKENPHSAARLTVSSVQIAHLVNGTGGYQIILGVTSTTALSTVSKDDQRIFLSISDKSGGVVYVEAVYTTTQDSEDVYVATLPLNYHITMDGYFTTSLIDVTGNPTDSDIPFTATFDVFTCVRSTALPTVPQDAELYGLLPVPLQPTWLVTAYQSLTIQFAEDLSNLLSVPVNTTWGSQTYQLYTTTSYLPYGKDQYLMDDNGTLCTRVVQKVGGGTALETIRIHKSTEYALSGLDAKLTITQSQSRPTATIAVDDVSTVLIGSKVSGQSIPVGTTVTAVDHTASTLTLSAVPETVTQGNLCYITNSDYRTTVGADQAQVGNTITLADASKALIGQTVAGFDIPEDTVVQTVSGNTVTLSQNTTAVLKEGALLQFVNKNGPYIVEHEKGQVMVDGLGKPIVLEDSNNVYGLSVPQFDGRLYAAEDDTSVEYVAEISSEITSTSHVLDPVRDTLLEETKLYYRPFRTIGTATFGIGDGKTTRLPLQQNYTVTYFVPAAVKDNSSLTDAIKSDTLTTLSQYVQNNTVISTEEIASMLQDQFSANITALEVGGINNDPSLRTIALLDKDVAMSIASVLAIDPVGKLFLDTQLTVNFVLDPSDTTLT